MKFDNSKTKGGHKILSIHGPDACEEYAGVVEYEGEYVLVSWSSSGIPITKGAAYSLVPLTEEPSDTTELWNYVRSSSKEITALREALADTLKKLHDFREEAIARVSGLRADYLADQSAVQPSRVDALEERLEAVENSFPCDGWFSKADDKLAKVQKIDTINGLLWSRVSTIQEDLTKRLEALEQGKDMDKFLSDNSGLMDKLAKQEEQVDNLVAHHKLTESFAADVWQRLNHFEDGLSKRVEALEKDTDGTVTNLFDRVNQVEYDLTSVRDQLQRTNFARRIETLEQFKQEMLKPLSQPTDKGVWVTRKTLIDAYLKTSNINDLAKRLGLEE